MSGDFITAELIRKKRDGGKLSDGEIAFLVKGFSSGAIPDYQVSAWLMASFIRGLSRLETVALTREIRDSGKCFDWRSLSPKLAHAVFADKHSSGGVGDKVSLVLAPVAACLGLKVPMMSGRGLGHTGGTVDKLHAIPGFTLQPDEAQMIECLEKAGVCMMEQRNDLCPADRKLYHLRDVTGTIESVPIITASIVSKKWAEGVDAIVFDVKCGHGAFMGTLEEARALSESLVETAQGAGLKARACITRMEEPLGSMIGNSLEVKECLWMLLNHYPSENHKRLAQPLLELSLRLAAEMALLAGTRKDIGSALKDARDSVISGRAHELFMAMAAIQGAHQGWPLKLPNAKHRIAINSPRNGTITCIRSRSLGLFGVRIGAGRETRESGINPAVGIEMSVTVGDFVKKGDPLVHLHLDDVNGDHQISAERFADSFKQDIDDIFEFDGANAPDPAHFLLERIPA